MSWLKKLLPASIRTEISEKKGVPEGLWTKCEGCETVLYRAELEKNQYVCPKCAEHHYIPARERLNVFLDAHEDNPRQELASEITAVDRLKFKDTKKYKDRISNAMDNTKENEALLVIQGAIKSIPVVACAFDFNFMGGSMGAAVGERFVQGVNAAIEKSTPFICFSASGGARMQEGLYSLMQMAKTSAVLTRLADQKLPFISVLTYPTMGGVSASLAMLGDAIIAEPKALIGFAGPRVIEQIVRTPLPEGFQRSEFLLSHGAIDMIVDRREMREVIARLLAKFLHMNTIEETA